MTKSELQAATAAAKTETQDALQTIYDALNQGQRKQLVKNEDVRILFDRYGVEYQG